MEQQSDLFSKTTAKQKNIADTIQSIKDIINDFSLSNIESFSEEDLSKKALHLSVLKSFISQSETELGYNIKILQTQIKTQRNDQYLKLKQFKQYSREDCKLMSDKIVRPLEAKEMKFKSFLETLKNLKKDTKDILDTIDNRIKILKVTQSKQKNLFG